MAIVPHGKSKKVIENPIAYVIKDKVFGQLEVKNSANAWWLEKGKVENLINVFKLDGTIEEASSNAGITRWQYDYFLEQHPQFSAIILACREIPGLKARYTVVRALDDPKDAQWYLERKKKKEFSAKQEIDLTSAGRPLHGLSDDELINLAHGSDEGTRKEGTRAA